MGMPERFKIIRESLGLSQKDMAVAIGISLPGLQGYEAGRSVPGGSVFEALVKLGFNANWLLTGEGEMRTNGLAFQVAHHSGPMSIKGVVNEKQVKYTTKPDLTWLHEWVDEELSGKSISEIMAVAVKIKGVLDDSKEG